MQAALQQQAQEKKKKPPAVPRAAGGEKWWDPTLVEWAANDFRCAFMQQSAKSACFTSSEHISALLSAEIWTNQLTLAVVFGILSLPLSVPLSERYSRIAYEPGGQESILGGNTGAFQLWGCQTPLPVKQVPAVRVG